MLIAVTSPIGIFNVSDVKPEFKSIDLNSGLTSDTLNIPIGLVTAISIASTKKHAIIQVGKRITSPHE